MVILPLEDTPKKMIVLTPVDIAYDRIIGPNNFCLLQTLI